MKFTSTRDRSLSVSVSEAILHGISSDGGLYVPEGIPKTQDLTRLIDLDYKKLALEILLNYFEELGEENLKNIISRAYAGSFPEEVVKLKSVGEEYILELFHGPTLALKI